MKQKLTFYRILSFILLPIEGLLGLMVLLMLLVSMANPAFLIAVFIMACSVLYTICSFIFLIKGVDNQRSCKPILKDLIKVNAFVTVLFAGICLFDAIGALSNPALLKTSVQTMMASQKNMPAGFTADTFFKMIQYVCYFMIVLALILLAHIGITFRLLKQHSHLFKSE